MRIESYDQAGGRTGRRAGTYIMTRQADGWAGRRAGTYNMAMQADGQAGGPGHTS